LKQIKDAHNDSVTIKDVAREAGVSIATVSRVLNDSSGVTSKLVEKVQAAITTTGYQFNAVARALKVKKSRSIGLIIPDIENPFFPALVRGIEDTARKYDYSIILCNSDGYAEEEKKYIRFLHSKQVDGVIFTGGIGSDENLSLLAKLKIPVVNLDRQSKKINMSSVVADNYYGATLAVEHLVNQGAKNIVFLGGPPRLSVAMERFEGYRDVLRKHDFKIADELILNGEFTFDSGYQNMLLLLKEQKKFDAVFAANDMIAFGVIECLVEHNIKVPEDVIVAGYDDIRMAAWYKPSLTTVRQPVYQMGQEAVKILMELMSDSEAGVKERKFRPELVVRTTTCVKD
jgi:DNA-binding LacI/PurR family transcriptional regulator